MSEGSSILLTSNTTPSLPHSLVWHINDSSVDLRGATKDMEHLDRVTSILTLLFFCIFACFPSSNFQFKLPTEWFIRSPLSRELV